MNEYTGKVTQIIHKTDDFLIAFFKTEEKSIKIVGNMYGIENGNELTIKGEWVTHPQYGQQLQVKEWKRPIPKTRDQAIAFLSSGLVKGVGKKRAVEIVDKLGSDAITIINNDEEKALSGIKGIGKKTARGIVESIKATFEVQEIISQLMEYGITANLTLKLYKEYGSETVRKVQENPYRLTEMDGMGFLKTDEIARKMGIFPTSGYRIGACIKFVLNQICFQKGHCFVEEHELVKETLLALNHNAKLEEQVQHDDLMQCIYSLEDKVLVIENNKVYPKHLFDYEQKLAQKLSILRGSWGG
ncbi:hypothetical protein D7X33_39425, partial [Butyricicoccus sp. 1XD8-22]